MSPGPRGAVVYPAPRGPGATPCRVGNNGWQSDENECRKCQKAAISRNRVQEPSGERGHCDQRPLKREQARPSSVTIEATRKLCRGGRESLPGVLAAEGASAARLAIGKGPQPPVRSTGGGKFSAASQGACAPRPWWPFSNPADRDARRRALHATRARFVARRRR